MKVSVLIPTYNSSATIRMTLDSVLQQTMPPDEILILDDGSRDNTVSILNSYGSRVKVLQRKNGGVASSRNELCARAQGDLIALLDHDDLWHPRYLEVQRQNFNDFPNAVAFFTGHVNFAGYGTYDWQQNQIAAEERTELLSPLKFFKAFTSISGTFGSASFFCVPKRVLLQMGREAFGEKVSGVDDCYFCALLSLLGSVVYCPTPLVAYRIINQAQSTDKVKACKLCVDVFQLLKSRYKDSAGPLLLDAFQVAAASSRRSYAKRLMGVTRVEEARTELRLSLRDSSNLTSIVKSFGMLFLSYMPQALQPTWPPSHREWKEPKNA